MTPLARRSLIGLAAASALVPLVGCSTSTTTAASSGTSSDAGTTTGLDGISSGSATVTFDQNTVTLNGAYLIDGVSVTADAGAFASSTADEAVFLVVNGGSLTLSGATITKSGDASANGQQNTGDVSDDYNFYGLNSAVVVIGEGSTATLADCTIDVSSTGSNAIFSSMSAVVTLQGATITTDGNSSRGLHATYEGQITGADLTITTSGAHSAALATDRGSGTVTVSGTNVLTTSGDGSPLIYSTGAITASGVTGTASGAQVLVIEGKNSITLSDSDVSSAGNDAMMVYQSMSGDAADANAQEELATLTVSDTTMTYTGTGPVLYFTNTSAEADLASMTFVADQASDLVQAAEDRWGTSGSNGGNATVTFSTSTLTGDIAAEGSSALTIELKDSTTWTGSTSGEVTVTPDSSSTAAS